MIQCIAHRLYHTLLYTIPYGFGMFNSVIHGPSDCTSDESTSQQRLVVLNIRYPGQNSLYKLCNLLYKLKTKYEMFK